MPKIRVNPLNSKIVDNKLYITMLKAQSLISKVLRDKIDFHTHITHPKIGKMVKYEGPFIRTK